MQAQVGDWLMMEGRTLDDTPRRGEITPPSASRV
jgi:hypothetical protein